MPPRRSHTWLSSPFISTRQLAASQRLLRRRSTMRRGRPARQLRARLRGGGASVPHGARARWTWSDGPMDELRIDLRLSLGDVKARAGDLTRRGRSSCRRRSSHAVPARRSSWPARPWASAAGSPGCDRETTAAHPRPPGCRSCALGGAMIRLRVQLLRRLACAWRSSPDQRDQSAALSRQAVELARELGDPATLSYALASRFWATCGPRIRPTACRWPRRWSRSPKAAGDAERMIDAQHAVHRLHRARAHGGGAPEAPGCDPPRTGRPRADAVAAWLGIAPVSLVALMDGDYAQASELLKREAAYGFPTTMARDDVSAWRHADVPAGTRAGPPGQ